jgi:hypothetical protein
MKSLFLVILLLSGCTTTQFEVNIDSISDPNHTQKTYIILPVNKGVKATDLQFKEYAAYVNRALVQQGLIQADPPNKADLVVFLYYGIGEPQVHNYSYSIPTFGQTGISSSNTTGSINSYGGYSSYSATTSYTPTFGVTGSIPVNDTVVTYSRFIILEGLDYAELVNNKKEIQLWKTTITSTGTSSDLRLVFPVMIGAAKEYFLKNSGKKIQVDISEDDNRVIEVKGIEEKKPVK